MGGAQVIKDQPGNAASGATVGSTRQAVGEKRRDGERGREREYDGGVREGTRRD